MGNLVTTEIKLDDNSKEVLRVFGIATERGLDAIGATAERYAKKDCPVDTGRLRNSITHATQNYNGQGAYTDNEGRAFYDATARRSPERGTVYIGTNVEYGPAVELGTSRSKKGPRPFLRPAASNHGSEFSKIMEESLKNA